MFAGNSGAQARTLLSRITLNWNDAQVSWVETPHLTLNLLKLTMTDRSYSLTKIENEIMIHQRMLELATSLEVISWLISTTA
jgi:hypothetical protein